MKKERDRVLVGVAVAISIFLRLPHYQHSLTFVDEGIYASTAAELLHGSVLYRDVWCNHMPLVIMFCKWMFQLLGANSLAIHAGSLLLALTECCLLYLVGSRFLLPRIGGWAAVAYAIISTNFYTPRIIGYTPEQPMVVLTTAAVYVFLRALQTDRPGGFFWAGILQVGAVLAKPAAAPEVLMFPLFLLFYPGLARRIRSLALFAAGCIAASGALVLCLGLAGNLQPWWDQSVLSRIYYASQISVTEFARLLLRQPVSFGIAYLWLWILLWAARRSPMKDGLAFRFVWLWLAAAFAGVTMGRRFYANYYIQLFPALALLAAVSLEKFRHDGFALRHRAASIACVVAFSIAFLWFQSRTLAHWYFILDPAAHQKATLWDMCVIDRNLNQASQRIRAATRPGDRIFVWGPSPEYYFLSGRRMATRYPFFDVMDPSQPPYQDEERVTLEALQSSPPALIVDSFKSAGTTDREGWSDLLARHYSLVHNGDGVRLYIRKAGLQTR